MAQVAVRRGGEPAASVPPTQGSAPPLVAVSRPKAPAPAGLPVTEPGDVDLAWAQDLVEELGREGPHKDYKKFADSTRKQAKGIDAFKFISDACESEGGFVDGTYLDPHTREQANVMAIVTGSPIGSPGAGQMGALKLEDRKKLCYYENISRTIRDAAWGHIQQSKDLIHRETLVPALEDFWRNTDGQNVSIDDFNEEPQQQSQMFGHGVVVVDRPAVAMLTQADEEAPENQPYAAVVPSANVVHWRFDEAGGLAAIAFVEPRKDDEEILKSPVKVWTRACWARFEPYEDPAVKVDDRDRYVMTEWGPNPIGKVPVAILYADRPKPKKLMGKSVMRDVAIINKTMFNQDSEVREVERLCGFPILCIPTKNPGSIKTMVISTGAALGYNANAGEPKYVTAPLDSIDKLKGSKKELKDAAFGMAHLAAILGHIETTSGFHSEVEFEKTNKRLGRNAASLEDYETRLAKLFLNWKGYTDEQIRTTPGIVSIAYPKTFQILDRDQLISRLQKQLDLKLGVEANRKFLTDFFSGLWPRMDKKEMEALVEAAAAQVVEMQTAAAGMAGDAINPAGAQNRGLARMLQNANTGKKPPPVGPGANLKGVTK